MNVRIAFPARLLESGALAVTKPAPAEKAVTKPVRVPRDRPSPAGVMRWTQGSLLLVRWNFKGAAAAIAICGIVLGLTLYDRGFAVSVPAEDVPSSGAFVRGLEDPPSGAASKSIEVSRSNEAAVTPSVEDDDGQPPSTLGRRGA